jgi:trk system potassium uptake protein TrkH
VVVAGYAVAVGLGTLLLWLPVSTAGQGSPTPLTALFTATSAVCVTGLTVVDTPSYWSGFGQAVILVLIQLGGFGLMTVGSLVGLFLTRRVGLRRRIATQAETKALGLGDVRAVVIRVAVFSAAFELLATVVLAGRFWLTYDLAPADAAYQGLFHAVSAFNNAGFALYPDNLVRFVTDPWINLTIAGAVILGGIGFPVLAELRRVGLRARRWSLHAKLTLVTTAALLVLGTVAVVGFEWANPGTLGPLSPAEKGLAGFFQGVMPRTAGFNSVDIGAMHEVTRLIISALMFIGGGSASTAGGIKVTTFALLAFVIWSELRGDPRVTLFGREAPGAVQRQALTVALLGVGLVVLGTCVMLGTGGYDLAAASFESISAFGTVGLSTGITPELPAASQLVLVVLMFLGRLGPITLFAALTLRERERLYHLPEERPIIG